MKRFVTWFLTLFATCLALTFGPWDVRVSVFGLGFCASNGALAAVFGADDLLEFRWTTSAYTHSARPFMFGGASWRNGFSLYGEAWPFLVASLFVLWRIRLSDQRIPPGHCQQCRYDLTGNASGTCPECGNLALPSDVQTPD